MPLTPAQKQAAYRARKAAQANPATVSNPEIEREEAEEKVEQLSRAAGSPRYPLSVMKRAAQHFIQGEGRLQAKVKALRLLCQSDNATRKALKEWVRQDRSEAARKFVEAQGWTLATEGLSNAERLSEVDRLVLALESGKELSAEDLAIAGDPEEQKRLDAAEESKKPRGILHGCNYCGFNNGPATRQIGDNYFCDRHDGKPTGTLQPVADPQSPAEYINNNFGKTDPNSPEAILNNPQHPLYNRVRELDAIRQANLGAAEMSCRRRGGADFGLTRPPEKEDL